jgi:hypothetical protein
MPARPANTRCSGDVIARTAVDSGADTITVAGHGFATGDGITYSLGATDQAIETVSTSDLQDGGEYFVIVVGDQVKLAQSYADALAGNAIDLAGFGMGAQHQLYSGDPDAGLFDPNADVDLGADTINLGAGHGLATGDR